MLKLKTVIASYQRSLKEHSLFGLMEQTKSVESLARLARAAAWWPMVFQDVLRLNVERVRGTGFERIAQYHKNEDAGHDRWYLSDLATLGVDPPGLDELFGEWFRPVRDASYSLLAEIHREQSGSERVAFLLALESTGHVFFEHISSAGDRICPELQLRYFSHSHLNVEKAHDLFTDTTEADLDKVVLSEAERSKSEAMVARVYDAFDDIFSYFEDRMLNDEVKRSGIRGLADVGNATQTEERLASSG